MPVSVAHVLLLAVIQGLTEFLPVSSSGHLVLVEALLGLRDTGGMSGVLFEVAVHVGTLGAIIAVYRRRIREICSSIGSFVRSRFTAHDRNRSDLLFVCYIIAASVPAALVGILLRARIESVFGAPSVTSLLLVATGCYLLLSRVERKERELGLVLALVIGMAQAVAVLPGCSRSGWTITTALLLGLRFGRAAEFSFLLSVPAILGALLVEVLRGGEGMTGDVALLLLLGAVVAFAAGWAALVWVLHSLRAHRFDRFAYYLIPAGLLGFIYFAFVR